MDFFTSSYIQTKKKHDKYFSYLHWVCYFYYYTRCYFLMESIYANYLSCMNWTEKCLDQLGIRNCNLNGNIFMQNEWYVFGMGKVIVESRLQQSISFLQHPINYNLVGISNVHSKNWCKNPRKKCLFFFYFGKPCVNLRTTAKSLSHSEYSITENAWLVNIVQCTYCKSQFVIVWRIL